MRGEPASTACEDAAVKWLVASLVVAACSRAATPTMPADEEGRAHRLQTGSVEAYALADGHLVVPNDGKLLGVGRPPSEIAELLAAAGLPRDSIRLDIQSLLVKTGDGVLLFDAGLGEASALPGTGQLATSLALAGVNAAAVTDVFISHAHSDHVAGLVTKTGALAFPAATIRMTAPEWSALQADTSEEGRRIVAVIAPKVMPFEPGAQVLPAVKATATPGHTAGHSSYEIAGELFYLGDLAHHSIISVQRPAWSLAVDGDRAAAEAVRQHTLAQLAAKRIRVFAPHFPFPGVGHVVAEGQGLVWRPSR